MPLKPFVRVAGAEDSQFAPILMLHGWALNHHVWSSFSEHYAVKYQTLAMDLPGHGRSHELNLENYDIDTVTDTIAAALDEPVIVLGWSLGAMLALNLTIRHPGKVEKLITVAGTAQFLADDAWPHGSQLETFMQFADGLWTNYRSTIERFLAIQALGSKHALSQIKRLKQIMFSEPDPTTQALSGGLEILKQARLQEQLRAIECPTLFVAGSTDKLIHCEASKATAELIASAQYREIRGAGHAPFISHPMEFYTALEDML